LFFKLALLAILIGRWRQNLGLHNADLLTQFGKDISIINYIGVTFHSGVKQHHGSVFQFCWGLQRPHDTVLGLNTARGMATHFIGCPGLSEDIGRRRSALIGIMSIPQRSNCSQCPYAELVYIRFAHFVPLACAGFSKFCHVL
jgi:hypothetical protein